MNWLSALRPTQTHLLTALAALFALAAVWPWIAPIPVGERANRERTAISAGVPALAAPAAFTAIAERPLFTPSRHPPAEAKAPVAAGAASRYRLLGLISVGTARRALVVDGTRRFELTEGSALDQWTVAHIEPDRVVLSGVEGETVLTLQSASAIPDTTPAQKR